MGRPTSTPFLTARPVQIHRSYATALHVVKSRFLEFRLSGRCAPERSSSRGCRAGRVGRRLRKDARAGVVVVVPAADSWPPAVASFCENAALEIRKPPAPPGGYIFMLPQFTRGSRHVNNRCARTKFALETRASSVGRRSVDVLLRPSGQRRADESRVVSISSTRPPAGEAVARRRRPPDDGPAAMTALPSMFSTCAPSSLRRSPSADSSVRLKSRVGTGGASAVPRSGGSAYRYGCRRPFIGLPGMGRRRRTANGLPSVMTQRIVGVRLASCGRKGPRLQPTRLILRPRNEQTARRSGRACRFDIGAKTAIVASFQPCTR